MKSYINLIKDLDRTFTLPQFANTLAMGQHETVGSGKFGIKNIFGMLLDGGALTDYATIVIHNNRSYTLTTAQSSLALQVSASENFIPNFVVEISPTVDCQLTINKVVDGTATSLAYSTNGGNTMEAGKIYQVVCCGGCWTLGEFIEVPSNVIRIGANDYSYVQIGSRYWITEYLHESVGARITNPNASQDYVLYNHASYKGSTIISDIIPSGWRFPTQQDITDLVNSIDVWQPKNLFSTVVGGNDTYGLGFLTGGNSEHGSGFSNDNSSCIYVYVPNSGVSTYYWKAYDSGAVQDTLSDYYGIDTSNDWLAIRLCKDVT